MAALLYAFQVDIPGPNSTTGWLFLLFAVALVAFLINEGLFTLVKKTYPHLKQTLFFFTVILVLGVLAANGAGWG